MGKADSEKNRGDFAKDEAWAEGEVERSAQPQIVPGRVCPAPPPRGAGHRPGKNAPLIDDRESGGVQGQGGAFAGLLRHGDG